LQQNRLHRASELTPVWVPDQAQEAIRDLMRARLAAVRTLRQARQQLSGFLLRQGHHYHRPAWTLIHRRWLAGLTFAQPVHHIVLEDCIAAVEAATAQRDRLEVHIEAALPDWSLAPVVRSLQALRGVAMVSAATLVAEPLIVIVALQTSGATLFSTLQSVLLGIDPMPLDEQGRRLVGCFLIHVVSFLDQAVTVKAGASWCGREPVTTHPPPVIFLRRGAT